MRISIDNSLPAANLLRHEGVIITNPSAADRKFRLGLVNLMPVKTETEYDFLKLLGNIESDMVVEPVLIRMVTHKSRNTSPEHIARFYTTFDNALNSGGLDGIIITGAPLENIAFENVGYWAELTDIFSKIRQLSLPSVYICWAAFAAMYHHHQVGMVLLDKKISGVFPHKILALDHYLMSGLQDGFKIPHSRFASWNESEIVAAQDIEVVAGSENAGIYIASERNFNEVYITGHGEYAAETLDREYRRDLSRGLCPDVPKNYYPDNDSSQRPLDTWSENASQIIGNWINQIKI